MNRVDERDIIFSRMNYEVGTDAYEDYYRRHPELQEQDDFLRSMPPLCSEGTPTFNTMNAPIVDACFAFLGDMNRYAVGKPSAKRVDIDPSVMTKRIKGLARYYNAKLVGIVRMNDGHYYSHRGRKAEQYGQEIVPDLPYGIVFAVEMDRQMVFAAPQLTQSIAVTKGYIEAAMVGMVLSYYIRALGYEARNHMDGNYLVVAPLVAQDAGLGEIGRNGLLITREYGPRVRLGVVTTDVPLLCDGKLDLGITQFCDECGKCAKTCPAKAIATGEAIETDHVRRWGFQSDDCYKRWRYLGNDCGICLASCPFSDSIPLEWTKELKTSQTVRQRILDEHEKKYPIRPYVKEKPDWLD